jgi:hypothetical protein
MSFGGELAEGVSKWKGRDLDREMESSDWPARSRHTSVQQLEVKLVAPLRSMRDTLSAKIRLPIKNPCIFTRAKDNVSA